MNMDMRKESSIVIDKDLKNIQTKLVNKLGTLSGEEYKNTLKEINKIGCAMHIKKEYEDQHKTRHIHLDFEKDYKHVARDIEVVLLNEDFQDKYTNSYMCENGNQYSDDVLDSYYTDIDY